MRRKIVIIIGILTLAGVAAGSYWYLQLRSPEDPIPDSGIFVMGDPVPGAGIGATGDPMPRAGTGIMEDSSCRHSI